MSDKKDFYIELNDLIIRAEMDAKLMKTLKRDVEELVNNWDNKDSEIKYIKHY